MFFQKQQKCPFCKVSLSFHAVQCTDCDAIKDFSRYNNIAIFLFGFLGSLLLPAILFCFAQINDTLASPEKQSYLVFSVILLVALCFLLFVISKLPFLRGRWMQTA